MPELPEVETVRRGLQPWLEGARIDHVTLNRPNLRFPFPRNLAQGLEGSAIVSVGRRAKYLPNTASTSRRAIMRQPRHPGMIIWCSISITPNMARAI